MAGGTKNKGKGPAKVEKPQGQDIRGFFAPRPVSNTAGQDTAAADAKGKGKIIEDTKGKGKAVDPVLPIPQTPASANTFRSPSGLNNTSSLVTPVTAGPSSLSRPLATPLPVSGLSFVKTPSSMLVTPSGPDNEVDEVDDGYALDPLEDDIAEDDPYLGDDDDDDDATYMDEPEVDHDVASGSASVGEKRGRDADQAAPNKTKHPRVEAEGVDAWFGRCNSKYSVTESDAPDIARFQQKFGDMTMRFCAWASGKWDGHAKACAWFETERSHREMTICFRNFLARANPDALLRELFAHMPERTQAVLGREGLTPLDLFDLPVATEDFKERLTYINVPTKLTERDVVHMEYANGKRRKRLGQGARLESSRETRVYVGSANDKNGGGKRLSKHELASIPKDGKQERGKQYDFTAQKDVVNNFRVLGAWQNILLPGRDTATQDTKRVFPVLLEGLMIVYLNLYDDRFLEHNCYAPAESFDLAKKVRQGLGLPDFAAIGLNAAWPLHQGVSGGFKRVSQCAWCERRAGPTQEIPGDPTGNRRWACLGDIWGARICRNCDDYRRENPEAPRTRAGTENGFFLYEYKDLQRINQVWFARRGTAPRCQNYECRVEFVKGCTIYGLESGARCRMCNEFRRGSGTEWEAEESEDHIFEAPQNCSRCHEDDVEAVRLRLLNNEPVCAECFAQHRCFGDVAVPDDVTRTVGSCGNPSCPTDHLRYGMAPKRLVRDTIQETWQCLSCDWSQSVLGRELSTVIDDVDEAFRQLTETPAKITHHEYNATQCVVCKHYATPWNWTKLDDTTFVCSMCNDAEKCSNADCDWSCVLAAQRGFVEGRCHKCHNWSKRIAGREGQSRQPTHRSAKHPKPADWDPNGPKCANPDCDHPWYSGTENNKGQNGAFYGTSQNDPSALRCYRCYCYRKRHSGEEWSAQNKRRNFVNTAKSNAEKRKLSDDEVKTCGNPTCGTTSIEDDGKFYGDPDGSHRCGPCYRYKRNHDGTERTLAAIAKATAAKAKK